MVRSDATAIELCFSLSTFLIGAAAWSGGMAGFQTAPRMTLPLDEITDISEVMHRLLETVR